MIILGRIIANFGVLMKAVKRGIRIFRDSSNYLYVFPDPASKKVVDVVHFRFNTPTTFPENQESIFTPRK
jgi:hypothetical protein